MVPKISIVIPAYNSEKFLTYTIDSVLLQSFTEWEMVLVNDGSTDATASIMQSYVARDPRIRMVSQLNKGLSGARNAGLSLAADTPYLIFLDSDDIWEPEALATLHTVMEADLGIVGAYGLARYIDQTGERVRIGELEGSRRSRASYKDGRVVSIEPDEPTTFFTLLVACCIQTPGVLMLRRSTMQIAGKFDEGVTYFEDLDFYLRLSRNGSFRLVDQVILNYRTHQNNHSLNRPKMRSSQQSIIRRVSNSVEYSAEQRRAAVDFYPAAQRYFAVQKVKYCMQSIREGNWPNGARQLKYATGYFVRMVVASAGRFSRKSI